VEAEGYGTRGLDGALLYFAAYDYGYVSTLLYAASFQYSLFFFFYCDKTNVFRSSREYVDS
jgi:hypothetical protein